MDQSSSIENKGDYSLYLSSEKGGKEDFWGLNGFQGD